MPKMYNSRDARQDRRVKELLSANRELLRENESLKRTLAAQTDKLSYAMFRELGLQKEADKVSVKNSALLYEEPDK